MLGQISAPDSIGSRESDTSECWLGSVSEQLLDIQGFVSSIGSRFGWFAFRFAITIIPSSVCWVRLPSVRWGVNPIPFRALAGVKVRAVAGLSYWAFRAFAGTPSELSLGKNPESVLPHAPPEPVGEMASQSVTQKSVLPHAQSVRWPASQPPRKVCYRMRPRSLCWGLLPSVRWGFNSTPFELGLGSSCERGLGLRYTAHDRARSSLSEMS